MSSATPTRWTTVLFDFDGTVAHTVPLIIDSYRATLAEYGLPERSDAEIATWIGLTLEDVFADLGFDDVATPSTFYRTWNESHHDAVIAPCPGVPALLDDLRAAGLDLRVVTSKGRVLAERGIRILGLGDLEVLVAKEDTVAHKPDPEPLLQALHLLGADAKDCVYVGDATYDVQCAKAAGMDGIAVTWGAGSRAALEEQQPLAVVDSADELKAVLLLPR